jgi:hypothetical protein
MNTYSPNGLSRMQRRDVANIHSTHPYLDGASLAALERQRGWRADAEAGSLLKQHGVLSAPAMSVITGLRR